MMDWTDRHCRYLHRLITGSALLYTEMVTAPALVRGGARHLIAFDPAEQPVALQLGGSDPAELARAAAMGCDEGYAEINLNVGCPSDRVQSGTFGAVLMKTPSLVADCAAAMIEASSVPVTVKCRIGVDDQEPREVLPAFLDTIRAAGISRVAIHARKAWLEGLSPRQNRDVPPLDYPLVFEMKRAFCDMHISLNGGVDTLDAALEHLNAGMDGVMIGRAAYHAPWDLLGAADARVFGQPVSAQGPHEVAHRMLPYIETHLAGGGKLAQVTRHMLGLFAGRPGARQWRRILSENAHRPGAGPEVVLDALSAVPADAPLRARRKSA